MKKYYLMAPGPTPVPSNVLLAMAQPMIHHRTPEYEALFIDVRAGLKRLFRTGQDVIPFTSSGTGAMEAAVANTLSSGDTVLVLRAGKFGERWEEICRAYGVRAIPVSAPFGETVPAERFAEALGEHPEARAVLMLPPGLSFCALSEKAWGHVKASRLPKYYFDLTAEWKAVSKNEAHFTPAVSIVLGLREVLRMIEAEGLQNVLKRHERLARATRSGVEALGLDLFAKATPSPALTAVAAPRGLDSEQVLAAYAASHNITIAGGQGEMKGKVFRLGHMGYVGDFDVLTALGALEQVLHELGQPVDFGAAVRAAQKVFAERS